MLKNQFLTVCCTVTALLTGTAWAASNSSGSLTLSGAEVKTTFAPKTDAAGNSDNLVSVNLTLDPAHVGKNASLFIVAFGKAGAFMKDSSGAWLPWNRQTQDLVMTRASQPLQAQETIVLEPLSTMNAVQGLFDVYVGYKLGNEFIFNARTFNLSQLGLVVTNKLNDSGVNFCANATSYYQPNVKNAKGYPVLLACPASGFEGQDGDSGRDATNNQSSDGQAGFSFTKIDKDGKPLSDQSTPYSDATMPWACVKDNVTQLLWEVNTPSLSSSLLSDAQKADLQVRIHSWDNIYSWFNTNDKLNGGSRGIENGGSCVDSSYLCDTEHFVAKVNQLGLCGYNDWRLPTREELLSIVDNSRAPNVQIDGVSPLAAIDPNFFPNTPALDYWSATPMANGKNDAWSVYFYYGSVSYNSNKNNRYRVRLVRG